MSWSFHKRKSSDMGSGRELACLCLLLLLLLENKPCFADDESSRSFIRGKKGLPTTLNPARMDQSRHKGAGPDKRVGDEVFGSEKRRVYTGPNPLHNR